MLQARQTIADFEIVRLLGKGGMGEVYEAEQKHPQRSVALKVLAPWLADDDDALQRFWREANVPAQLDHPGIVRIFSMGKIDGIAYYTMHLVRGVSLTEFIREGTQALQPSTLGYSAAAQATPSQKDAVAPSPPVEAAARPVSSGRHRPPLLKHYFRDRFGTVARIGAMAARVLGSAHGQGFLHRDVKPSNLMIDQHDHLYLVDFGLTRALEPGADGTRAGLVVGTPWYMSPEQAHGQPVDARSDIYSLGITLYELASRGVGPFTASREDSQSVLDQVREGSHLPLRSLVPDVPPLLEEVIARCMQLDPRKRYQRAIDLATDLEALTAEPSALPVTALHRIRFKVLVHGAGNRDIALC
ncbi:MAG: serine/threonine protein kinase [Planctomycetes bacterium]|nr:serine/threonine protein kinase [Planctomycetota bacterium]